MTAAQFIKRWGETYPEAPALTHQLGRVYPARWFRIHSLPNSKRYAATEAEWQLLLDRQNTLLTDLLGHNSEVVLVSGTYESDDADVRNSASVSNALSNMVFINAERIGLYQLDPTLYEPGTYYQSKFSMQTWQPNRFDALLKEIADDQTRAFFISWRNACVVVPYDGGVDILLKDSLTRDYYREKYRAWLSARPDGL